MNSRAFAKRCAIALCLIHVLGSLFSIAVAQAPENDRLPPSISHQQTLRLFEQQKFEQAFKAALHRFEWGDNDLHYPIGIAYRNGWGTSRDLYKAREHLKLSAERGSQAGQYQYAEMLRLGQGGSLDPTTACRFYEKARAANTSAGFQSALCVLRSGNTGKGLMRLHQTALLGHSAATKRLLTHYRQHKPDTPNTSPYYADALHQWANQELEAAQDLAKKAIQAGDYRAYAVLGESQREQPAVKKELLENQIEIGKIFGSALPQYATGQRLLAQGYAQPACKFFLLSYQRGFQLAGIEVAQCMEDGHIATQADSKTACDYLASAFEAGYRQSAQKWLQCQIDLKGTPLTLAQAYVRAYELDPLLRDVALAHSICDGLPTHTLAVGSEITLHNKFIQRIDHPAIDACELQRDEKSIVAFAPQTGWLATVSPYELILPVVRYGLALEGLTRDKFRRLLKRDRIALMPLDLTPQRDLLRPKSTDSIAIVIDYSDNGDAIRIVESCKRCGIEHFEQRRRRLSTQLGNPVSNDDSDTFSHRSWQIQNWDIQLMLKTEEQQMRQVFTQRGHR